MAVRLPALRTTQGVYVPIARAVPLLVVRCLPSRRAINVALNMALLGLLVLSFVTGWIASWLGMTEFGLHKYGSLALLVVAVGHLVLHWKSFVVQMKRLVNPDRPASSPTEIRSAGHKTAA